MYLCLWDSIRPLVAAVPVYNIVSDHRRRYIDIFLFIAHNISLYFQFLKQTIKESLLKDKLYSCYSFNCYRGQQCITCCCIYEMSCNFMADNLDNPKPLRENQILSGIPECRGLPLVCLILNQYPLYMNMYYYASVLCCACAVQYIYTVSVIFVTLSLMRVKFSLTQFHTFNCLWKFKFNERLDRLKVLVGLCRMLL